MSEEDEGRNLYITRARTRERFHRLKDHSAKRTGNSELYNGDFLSLLLDVWEDRLVMALDEFPDCPECESRLYVVKRRGVEGFRCRDCEMTFTED